MLEAELFGSVKGGYTDARDRVGRFEAANGGTLFLDEIGEIPLSMQVKLLRTLESRTIQRVGDVKDIPVDFRLVTATNKSLAALVTEGKFREDLYYRLNVIEIHTPALKDHPEDIALIAARFVHEFSTMNGGRVTGIDPELVKALEAMPWPGNVRQLRNLVERMVVLSQGGNLTIADLPPGQQGSAAPAAPSPRLADTEKEQILSALKACGGNKSKAAQMLGVSRRTIHRKLAEWGMA
ncbi:MAG: sigma-54-dependent Fis family transcriptional regulator [Kiritimatiellae bacterium]|nr:sigma-54-dependent Fis family transcriptional regulator [Kiritimatiellia bacterium]